MNCKKQIFLFILFLINWGDVFSQIDQTKIDSLKRYDKQYADNIELQIKKIDSLKMELIKFDLEKRKIDSLKRENENLRSTMMKYCDQMNNEILDSIETSQIKTGYYFRILPKEDDMDEFYNEIEWVYITENNEVKLFVTANYEYCMLDMYFARKPKEIYKQIKRNQEKFDSLYLLCNQGQNTVPSIVKNDNLIILSPQGKYVVINDVLIFQKNRITRRIRKEKGFDSFTFEYIGK